MNVREEFASIAESIVLESEKKGESEKEVSAEEMFNISVSDKVAAEENIPEVKEEMAESAEAVSDKTEEKTVIEEVNTAENTEEEKETIPPVDKKEESEISVFENIDSTKSEPDQKTDSDDAKTEKKRGFFGRLFGKK